MWWQGSYSQQHSPVTAPPPSKNHFSNTKPLLHHLCWPSPLSTISAHPGSSLRYSPAPLLPPPIINSQRLRQNPKNISFTTKNTPMLNISTPPLSESNVAAKTTSYSNSHTTIPKGIWMVSDFHSEIKGSWFKFSQQLNSTVMSSLQYSPD